MKKSQRRELHEILGTQSYSRESKRMRRTMQRLLEDAGMRVVAKDGNVFAVKGDQDGPVPIFVAHLDTVHKHIGDAYQVIAEPDDGDFIYWAYRTDTGQRVGIGGDDKCGLWVALQASKRFDSCRVVLLRDEEIGTVGASASPAGWYKNASVVIEADRRGSGDAVSEACGTRLSSDEWQAHVGDIVLDHGYVWEDGGGLTDVVTLAEENKITTSCINLSAGYHQPHTANETVVESELENCLSLAVSLARASEGRTWDVPIADRNTYTYTSMDWKPLGFRNYRVERGKFTLVGGKDVDPEPESEDAYWAKEEERYLQEQDEMYAQTLKCPTCGVGGMMYDRREDMVLCMECNTYVQSADALR